MTESLKAGIELMLAGMGIVFLFLALLVVAVNVMSSLIQRYLAQVEKQTSTSTAPSEEIDRKLVAAIGAAVSRYRIKYGQIGQ
ncbi:MAG: OadG family protein [Gammaproteobacteria bacterium]